MNYLPLNLVIMGNPLNWIIIPLMVLFSGLAMSYVFHPGHHVDTEEPHNG